MLANKCKTSKQCDVGEVCDAKKKVCRESQRHLAMPKATLAKECLKKGIPLSFERGPRKGERKTREAMRRCTTQKDRNIVKHDPKKVKLLGAPPVESPFVRPPLSELLKMKKAELEKLFKQGQKKRFIDPSKRVIELTNKQLANAITRARHQKW